MSKDIAKVDIHLVQFTQEQIQDLISALEEVIYSDGFYLQDQDILKGIYERKERLKKILKKLK